ncbi:phosphatidylserine decarboxylase family protein [Marinigracilibium pacificum]|uniref:Phosphatidylserine decarboxylase proenzyme n=1 Tax=Marinigracilibium pacificum TaxID=2729599 RepID=A0A848IU99_9BACT|nr:phosphatidylserine decarboxylase family protein [Marinigracilibium pacificum]NMM46875.1 phosphatidylserine decarboxylase family protein [Marinigracilibium pacificum]
MTIHKEGRVLLIAMLLILTGINLLVYYFAGQSDYALPLSITASVIIFLLVLQFFRSPKFPIDINSKHVIAPADGKVVVIEDTVEQEYLKDKRKQVSIFMSPVNVHVNRNPVSGIVSYFKYHPGKYLVAWHPKSSLENERTTIAIKMESGLEVVFRQVAGAMARRIKWYVKEGDKVNQGDEFGFIKFGSRVDIYLPLDADIKVNIGQKTKGGRTIIAEV